MGYEVNLPTKAILYFEMANRIFDITEKFDSSAAIIQELNIKAMECIQNAMFEVSNYKDGNE